MTGKERDRESGSAPENGRNPIRWLYDWVLSWADTPYGAIALFVLAFAEATFFPIPPDVLLVALVLGARTKAFRLALICTAGSVLGGIGGFALGLYAWETVRPYFVPLIISEENFVLIRKWYNENVFLLVFSAAFSPIPFKVFTIASGVSARTIIGANFFLFLGASIAGRGIRFFAVSYLLYRFGEPIRDWIDRYFNVLTLILALLLVFLYVLFRL